MFSRAMTGASPRFRASIAVSATQSALSAKDRIFTPLWTIDVNGALVTSWSVVDFPASRTPWAMICGFSSSSNHPVNALSASMIERKQEVTAS